MVTELKEALYILESITDKTKKNEIKDKSKHVYGIVSNELVEQKRASAPEYWISNNLLGVIECSNSLNHTRYGHKSGMLIRVQYAIEYLKAYIESTEKGGV